MDIILIIIFIIFPALSLIYAACYCWKHKPRDKPREYKDMFEQYRPKDDE